MEIKTYLQYKQVYGRTSTLSELHAALAKVDRSAMLRVISAIGFSLNFLNNRSSEDTQRALISQLFPQFLASQILTNQDGVFHRHQLLFLAQEVLQHCSDLSVGSASPRLEELGLIFLMTNDHLYRPAKLSNTPHGDQLQLILDFLPVSEANLFTTALLKMARAHLMVTTFAENRRGQPGFFDIPFLFHQATGIHYRTFEALMAGVFTRLVNVQGPAANPTNFGLPISFFDQLPVDKGEIAAFFRIITSTPEQYATQLGVLRPRPNDFRVIRDKPLVRITDVCLPIDAHSALEKFESGVYWNIFESLSEEAKKSFPSFWGKVFEDYALWLLAESCDGKRNRLYRNPKYADDLQQEVCDAIIVCDRTAIFIEIKGNTITSEGKYGADVDLLKNELEKKYVGTERSRKGVRQLVAAIETTCRRRDPRLIENIDLTFVSAVMPLLVTRDDMGGYFGVNAYLNARFRELFGRSKFQKSVTPCFCLCSDTLEKLTPYLCDTALAEILASRLKADRTLRAPFFARIGSILERKNKGGPDRQPTLLKDATFAVRDVAREVYGVVSAVRSQLGSEDMVDRT